MASDNNNNNSNNILSKRVCPEGGCCESDASKKSRTSTGSCSRDHDAQPTPEKISKMHWVARNPRRDEPHAVVDDYEAYASARRKLLEKEKELTILRDHIARDLQALPWLRVSKGYTFLHQPVEGGPVQSVPLRALFGEKEELIVQHIMFDEGWERPCAICCLWCDGFNGQLPHILSRASFVGVAKARPERFAAICKEKGWRFQMYSSADCEFNSDFRVEQACDAALHRYNFGTGWAHPAGQLPGVSIFHRVGDDIFFTNGTYSRGLDALNPTHMLFDMLPFGREGFQAKHSKDYE